MTASGNPSIGRYLLDELHRLGVRHIFGVPGDYVLGFCGMVEKGPIRYVNTTREDSAALAADAYARVRGLGVACVTYGVGALNCANAVAGAHAEKSPVLLISGAPGVKERAHNPLLHHRVGDFDTQWRIFRELTVASASLKDASSAHAEIDRVLHAIERYRRPGYIELPRDMVDVSAGRHVRLPTLAELTDEEALADCMREIVPLLNRARRPVILAGVEVHRFGLQKALVELLKKTNIPVAATLLGKSVLNETHPLYLGIYEGAMGQPAVQKYVEAADCILMLGCFMSDIDLGIFTAHLDPHRTISATSERLAVHRHTYDEVPFRSFFAALLKAPLRKRPLPRLPARSSPWGAPPAAGAPLTVRSLFGRLNEFVTPDMVVISDIGESLFGAIDLTVRGQTEFLSDAFYTSMGFSVPASLGAQLANPRLRPLVLVGDGAFQMTGMELSSHVRQGLCPIVIVLNNRGYGTERQIQDGAFNDITNWDFSQVPRVLGAGLGFSAGTGAELDAALDAALRNTKSFSIIDAHLDPYDTSPALRRLGECLRRRVKGKE
jgi:indolepyruvate decarboxylase